MRMRTLLGSSVVLAASVASAEPTRLAVTSDAFRSDDAIPVQYTCDGAGKAPTLSWTKVPADTKSIAILVDDPDAERGPFTHLLATNIPSTQTSLDLGGAAPAGASIMRNDTESEGYLAPCPENGLHHYHFRVYALDAPVRRAPVTRAVTRETFLRGLRGHVLAEGELVGIYESR
jgi:Raf kinase inhibitor-like YbhB/YbcL family protein